MMEENEYKDNEKVLYKTRGKLSLPQKEHEEADCIITEGRLVIETEQPIKITLHPIKEHKAKGGAVTVMYLDDLNQKRQLSMEMAHVDA